MVASNVASTEFDVHHVERLAQARERLMHNGTGCVLLDLSLPDANRLEALMQLRAAAPDVPIVILSGLQDELLAVKAVQEGAQDYLIKGRVDGVLLARALRYAVERKRADHNARRLREVEMRQAESRRLERGLLPKLLVSSGAAELVSFYRPGRHRARHKFRRIERRC